MPDQTGRIILVTGANAGIGYVSLGPLLRRGATVLGLCRNRKKSEEAFGNLQKELGDDNRGSLKLIECDLADLHSIKLAVEQIKQLVDRVDVLFASAGVHEVRTKTKQGHEAHFGVNVLGHYYLITLLEDHLVQSVQRSPRGTTRVVITSSSAYFLNTPVALQGNWNPSDSALDEKFSLDELYARSKVGNLHLTRKLSQLWRSRGIIVCSVHPGNFGTSDQRDSATGLLERLVFKLLLWPPEYSAINQLFAGMAQRTDTEEQLADKLHDAHIVPWARFGTVYEQWLREDMVEKTWKWCSDSINKDGMEARQIS
ncbi:NAD-P-binding protein [Acaromyces ingoldii]|uniref:NAD-P-binding protein n=1 Tax=Acaromyces ingoldii TaxID=215250 RepID=A0A316YSG2_9BASI|nr:NAD-P-binding protein [Acaromyces ingoldii]PWN92249.1 NAD-P-binding protein [Acaromyces ingoldii]